MSSYIAIDTEHGGFHPTTSLLSIGFAVFDPLTGEITDQMHLRVQHDIYSVDPLALEVNKINLVDHHKIAYPISECRALARSFLASCIKDKDDYIIPVGSSVAGDVQLLKNNGFYTSKISHKVRDLTVIASSLIDAGKLPDMKVGLQDLASYFGIYPGQPHNAFCDAITSARVYWKLMNIVRGVEVTPYEGYL